MPPFAICTEIYRKSDNIFCCKWSLGALVDCTVPTYTDVKKSQKGKNGVNVVEIYCPKFHSHRFIRETAEAEGATFSFFISPTSNLRVFHLAALLSVSVGSPSLQVHSQDMSEDEYEPEYETERICIGKKIWLEVLSVVRTFNLMMRIALQ